MRYVLVTPPAVPVVSLDEAKAHLRVDSDDEDTLIEAYVAAAIAYLDGRAGILGRAMISQTWRIDAESPCGGRIGIDMPDVQSVASVKYLASGIEQTWSSAQWRLGGRGNRFEVLPRSGYGWPGADNQDDAYRVSFVAGYGDDPEDVPAPLRAAILLHAADMYEFRETAVTGTVAFAVPNSVTYQSLIGPYRVRAL